jgi:hypothetical protein
MATSMVSEEQSKVRCLRKDLGCRKGGEPRKGWQTRESQANLFAGKTLKGSVL